MAAMARKRAGAQPGPDQSQPRLTEPLPSVDTKISDRIEKGRALLSVPEATQDLKEREREMYTWNDYNHTLLRRLLGPAIADEYRGPVSFGGSTTPEVRLREFEEDVASYLRQLESIRERLGLWEAEPDFVTQSPPSGPPHGFRADGAIFVVHGTNLGRANEVARVLESATAHHRDVVILHEKPNRGRTLIEKFEQHAAEAAFAVVVLTADDEGRKEGTELLRPRGRQNVIFELGFFFALLGRERVVVLLEPDIEQPSDVHGLVYEALDPAGAWKQALVRELGAAGIPVDRNLIR